MCFFRLWPHVATEKNTNAFYRDLTRESYMLINLLIPYLLLLFKDIFLINEYDLSCFLLKLV